MDKVITKLLTDESSRAPQEAAHAMVDVESFGPWD